MIELNNKTKQDFLDEEWVSRLLSVGVNMLDCRYWIVEDDDHKRYITLKSVETESAMHTQFVCPTYTISELLYKLHEYIYPTINGVEYSGMLTLYKDAPFYPAMYELHDKDGKHNDDVFMCPCEYPIDSLASLLYLCHTNDIGIGAPDTGDISDK